jgi:hypothetical protein
LLPDLSASSLHYMLPALEFSNLIKTEVAHSLYRIKESRSGVDLITLIS